MKELIDYLQKEIEIEQSIPPIAYNDKVYEPCELTYG